MVNSQKRSFMTRFLERVHEYAKSQGFASVECNAQQQAMPFYEKCGYQALDEKVFLEEGQPHLHLSKRLL